MPYLSVFYCFSLAACACVKCRDGGKSRIFSEVEHAYKVWAIRFNTYTVSLILDVSLLWMTPSVTRGFVAGRAVMF